MLRGPGLRIADGALLIRDDGSSRQVQMIGRPKPGWGQYEHGRAQRGRIGGVSAGKPIAQYAYDPGRDDQIQDVGDQQRYRDEHIAHVARGKIIEQSETRSDVEINSGNE